MLTIYPFQRSEQLNYCSFTLSVPYVCILLSELDILATWTTCKQSIITVESWAGECISKQLPRNISSSYRSIQSPLWLVFIETWENCLALSLINAPLCFTTSCQFLATHCLEGSGQWVYQGHLLETTLWG